MVTTVGIAYECSTKGALLKLGLMGLLVSFLKSLLPLLRFFRLKRQSQVMLRGILMMTFKIFHMSYRCTTK